MIKKGFKIAHLSDLHISHISFHIKNFFSKKWLAVANLLISRKKNFSAQQLLELPQLLKDLHIDLVIIAGDMTSSSSSIEFTYARHLLNDIEKNNIRVLALPGNHDNYTQKAHQNKTFYKYFTNNISPNGPLYDLHLAKDGIEAHYLWKEWYYVGLDCSIATSLFSSRGLFSERIEQNLYHLFDKLPKDSKIILVNHFPLFSPVSSRKILLRHEALERFLQKYPNIIFYLHGHTHQHIFSDLRHQSYPIILDSGSAAHNSVGSFNVLELLDHQCIIDTYKRREKKWMTTTQKTITV
ncbi:MAG: metallophosphoesterase [Parachlamydiales bacterium]|nr:metallophosphoesterase [Parachlamydiales bacterium]